MDLEPYKGSESYQVEDFDLFFGREREAEQVTALILASRLSLLHAASGAGKTSLLNARVIPFLESSRWLPVRTLLQNDPIRAIRTAVLRSVVACPEVEARALDRIFESCPEAVGPDSTIAQLVKFYDTLPIRDSRSRTLLMPVPSKLPTWVGGHDETGRTIPFISRILRSTCSVERFNLFIQAVDPAFPKITLDTKLGELKADLQSASCVTYYRDLVGELEPPATNLVHFFNHLWAVMGRRFPSGEFAVVLIIDQFEEIFTRYVDRNLEGLADGSLPDWRLRLELFDELRQLHESLGAQDQSEDSPRAMTLPLHIVISMRDEFIAHLDPIRKFAWNLDEASFHLDFIARKEAATVIQEPARYYGYSYSPECSDRIVDDLTREGRVVEPAHIQIICTKLWSVKQPEISLQLYQELGGTRGILDTYFDEFLDRFGPAEALTIVELLEPLITSSGTRNIVEETSLVHQPLWRTEERRRLLSELVNRNIIRIEPRLGGRFVEITHEFLIRRIREKITQLLVQDPAYARLRDAIAALRDLEHQNFRCLRSEDHLSRAQFESLSTYRESLDWPAWAREVMFRAAIRLGAKLDHIRAWAELLRADPVVLTDEDILSVMPRRRSRSMCLAAIELQTVVEGGAWGKAIWISNTLIARSLLEEGTDGKIEELRTWFRWLAEA